MNKLLLVASALINYGVQIIFKIISVHFPANLQVHILGVFDFYYDEMSNANINRIGWGGSQITYA